MGAYIDDATAHSARPGARLPGRGFSGACPDAGSAGAAGSPTATSARIARRPRGPRRRRDLGADAVGPARASIGSAERPGAHHPGHAALAARALVPGHAQRDPAGRPWRAARSATGSGTRSRAAGWASTPRGRRGRRRRRSQDFSLPPHPGVPRGRIERPDDRRRDRRAGTRARSAGSAAAGPARATTGADGGYAIGGMPGARYPSSSSPRRATTAGSSPSRSAGRPDARRDAAPQLGPGERRRRRP